MIDTHIHLNSRDYESDLDSVIKRAKDEGVQKMICIGMDYPTSLRALSLAMNYPSIYATLGIHPSYVDEASFETLDDLLPHYQNKHVVAVGECGIDLYWRQDNLERQQQFFIKQIELSIALEKPLIIHMRNSFDEIMACLKPYKGKVFGVFHCFSGTLEQAELVLEYGFYIGVDGPITYKKNQVLRDVIREIPLDKMVIETDGPYLSPEPVRSKRNESSYLKYIVEKIAVIKNITTLEVVEKTSENALKLFFKGETIK